MGIRGLWRFVRSAVFGDDVDGGKEKSMSGGVGKHSLPLPRGSTLLVDGSGFLFHLYEMDVPLQRGAGRSYEQLNERVQEWVKKIRSKGINVVFFWDGNKRPVYKAWTLKKRKKDREEREMEVLMRKLNLQSAAQKQLQDTTPFQVNMAIVNDAQSADASAPTLIPPIVSSENDEKETRREEAMQQRKILEAQREINAQQSLPSLAELQVRATLKRMKVTQRECAMEADMELAVEASGKKSVFILANDSDFLLFRGVQYINFGDVSILRGGVHARICSRKEIARKLGLSSENMLVEFALYAGNDYTHEFPKTKFVVKADGEEGACYELDVGNVRASVYGAAFSDVVASLKNAGENAKLWSADESLNDALAFSRAYYDMDESLRNVDAIADDTDSDLDSDDDEDDFILIGKSISEDFLRRMRGKGAIGAFVLSKMLECEEDGARAALFDACRAMLEGFDDDSQSPDFVLTTWESQEFTKQYERRCRMYLKQYPFLRASNEPRHLFHGPTFQRQLAERLQHQLPVMYPESDDDDDDAGDAITIVKALPIDSHREKILESIRSNQITIIEGETGCGKSSRVPVMIMEDIGEYACKIMVSQPRRIAAHSLYKRLCSTVGKDRIALRMGHGTREGAHDSDACITFATSGYMSLLAAHKPHVLGKCSHIIIDEIHERSIDADMLVYYMRTIIQRYPNLKLVLMSATLCEDTYAKYYGATNPSLFVGVKRFPLTEVFLDDIATRKAGMRSIPKEIARHAASLAKMTSSICCKLDHRMCDQQIQMAHELVRVIGVPGKAILIFVPGLATIEKMCEVLEEGKGAGRFAIVVIHSDVPFEEQLAAFDETAKKEKCKVILATNAAESSITLPNVDDVICLGLAKRMEYSAQRRSSILMKAWISKASAAQRAGRTARVRPGTVWRLYSRNLFDGMAPYELPEMMQVPLDHLIIRLKASLGDCSVVEVLEDALDPPDLSRTDDAFSLLHEKGFIDEPSDEGSELTSYGRIAASMGIDLDIAYFICISMRLGCGVEAIAIAAAISEAKLPFRSASHFVHKEHEIIDIVRRVMRAQHRFDAGLASMPLMLVRLVMLWQNVKRAGPSAIQSFVYRNGIVKRRMRQVETRMKFLHARIEDACKRMGIDSDFLGQKLRDPSKDDRLANRLRLCLYWSFEDTLMVSQMSKLDASETYAMPLKVESHSAVFPSDCLDQLLKGTGDYEVAAYSTRLFRIRFNILEEFNAFDDDEFDIDFWHELNASSLADACSSILKEHDFDICIRGLGSKKKVERIVWVHSNAGHLKPSLEDLFGAPEPCGEELIRYSGPLKRKRDEKALKALFDSCERSIKVRYQSVGCVGEITVTGIAGLSQREVDDAIKEVLGARAVSFSTSERVTSAKTFLRFPCAGDAEFECSDSDDSLFLTPLGARMLFALQNHSKRYSCRLPYVIPANEESRRADDEPVVGSKEWHGRGHDEVSGDAADMVVFRVGGKGATLVNDSSAKVLLGKHDLVGYTRYHAAKQKCKSRYISCSVLYTQFSVVAHGLTLLPHSKEWLDRAMGCSQPHFVFDGDDIENDLEYQIEKRITGAYGNTFTSKSDVEENIRIVDEYFRDHIMSRIDQPKEEETKVLKATKANASMVPAAVLMNTKSSAEQKQNKKAKPKKAKKKSKKSKEKVVNYDQVIDQPKAEETKVLKTRKANASMVPAAVSMSTKSSAGQKQTKGSRIYKEIMQSINEVLGTNERAEKFFTDAASVASEPDSEAAIAAMKNAAKDEKRALLCCIWIKEQSGRLSSDESFIMLYACSAFAWDTFDQTKTYLKKRKNEFRQAWRIYQDNFSKRGRGNEKVLMYLRTYTKKFGKAYKKKKKELQRKSEMKSNECITISSS